MADHQHVQVLIDGVDGIGPRRIGAGGKHISLAADLDDVRRMSAARPLGVIGMDSAALERSDGVLDKAGFVQSVGVDGDLYIVRDWSKMPSSSLHFGMHHMAREALF